MSKEIPFTPEIMLPRDIIEEPQILRLTGYVSKTELTKMLQNKNQGYANSGATKKFTVYANPTKWREKVTLDAPIASPKMSISVDEVMDLIRDNSCWDHGEVNLDHVKHKLLQFVDGTHNLGADEAYFRKEKER